MLLLDKWFPFAAERLRSHCWDDGEGVVFNRVTGETHQVGFFAIELLSALDPRYGSTAVDLFSSLSDVFVDFAYDDSAQMIEGALSELESFGLVKRTSF